MKISILGSGSSGNSTFIESDSVKLLIDVGFSCKKIEGKLKEVDEKLENIDGILITHEHGDHIIGAGIISRKYDIPIFITSESYEKAEIKLGKVESRNINFINGDFKIKELNIEPFDVMHDAVRTLGFLIKNSIGKKLAISTDIGYVDNTVKEKFKEVDIMIIESNYDYHMLMNCSYPWDLKERVKGRNGHLSNEAAGKFICEVYSKKLKKVYLAHVSKDSNNHSLAMKSVTEELNRHKIEVHLEIATQDKVTPLYKI